jgi:hypothetical protein
MPTARTRRVTRRRRTPAQRRAAAAAPKKNTPLVSTKKRSFTEIKADLGRGVNSSSINKSFPDDHYGNSLGKVEIRVLDEGDIVEVTHDCGDKNFASKKAIIALGKALEAI